MFSLKPYLFLFLLLLSFSAGAKCAPKWKSRDFKSTASGLQYSICKTGKGDSIRMHDIVWAQLYKYQRTGGKLVFQPDPRTKGTTVLQVENGKLLPGMIEAVGLLKKGGSGFFILPPSIGKGEDSIFTFIRIEKIAHVTIQQDSVITTSADSIHFTVTDPAQSNYGDSLFTTMKLVEAPKLYSCGHMESWVAFRFQLTWFDNGVQRKDILVYIRCPESYGPGYFVAGKTYVITAIPLTENRKEGKAFFNAYSGEKLETYLCLRIAGK